MTNAKLRLESNDGKQSSVLVVENATILVSWKSFGNSGTASHRLSTLSPDFAYHETFRGNPAGPFQLGLFGLLIIAFTTLTSLEIEGKPAILILGGAVAAIGFLITLSRLPKTRNTLIMKNDETSGIAVDHRKFDPASFGGRTGVAPTARLITRLRSPTPTASPRARAKAPFGGATLRTAAADQGRIRPWRPQVRCAAPPSFRNSPPTLNSNPPLSERLFCCGGRSMIGSPCQSGPNP